MSDHHPASIDELKKIAKECRIDILTMLEKAKSGHPGGSLSAIDIVTALFFSEMKMDPKNPAWEGRDRFVLSKGHAVPALYAVLAKKGAIPHAELSTLRQTNSRLQGHPDRHLLPVVEASTGSLGQGFSIAQGIALAMKLAKSESRVYCLIGDGESQEGQIWETAMSAPKFKLDNFVLFLDNNNGQIDGHVDQVMNIKPICAKWKAFGWETKEINGHDMGEITEALKWARTVKEKPVFIHANTVKGKGVSFMENNIGWHGVAPTADDLKKAIAEIGASNG
jgi:transketolase